MLYVYRYVIFPESDIRSSSFGGHIVISVVGLVVLAWNSLFTLAVVKTTDLAWKFRSCGTRLSISISGFGCHIDFRLYIISHIYLEKTYFEHAVVENFAFTARIIIYNIPYSESTLLVNMLVKFRQFQNKFVCI